MKREKKLKPDLEAKAHEPNPAWQGQAKRELSRSSSAPEQGSLGCLRPHLNNQTKETHSGSVTQIRGALKRVLAWKKWFQFWGEGGLFIPIIPNTWRNTFPFLKHCHAEHFHPPGYGRQREREEDSAVFIKCALPSSLGVLSLCHPAGSY